MILKELKIKLNLKNYKFYNMEISMTLKLIREIWAGMTEKERESWVKVVKENESKINTWHEVKE